MEKTQNFLSLQSKTNPQTKCEVSLIGGGVTTLFLNGTQIYYFGPRPDSGKAFTHPCIPNFHIAKNLPNHGPARKDTWKKVSEDTISWEMKEIAGFYPAGIKATRKFEFENDSFVVTTTITNSGETALPTNIAEHCYFNCPLEEVRNVRVNGVLFHEEAQKANPQFNPWQDENILDIPGIGEIEFITKGYKSFAQWSQIGAAFACVEPIETMPPEHEEFADVAPKILPGETKVFKYWIRLK